ncbi:MAG: hypothetical protein EBS53_17195, partial [Bacteroidetes bacterium]|nr:hypothetical protein [Bacteroidota bacterium]
KVFLKKLMVSRFILKVPTTRTAEFSSGVGFTANTTNSPGYTIYSVTSTSTTSETVAFYEAFPLQYLVVAGGGAGVGNYDASQGGGGAGGLIYNSNQPFRTNIPYRLTIGAGGAGGYAYSGPGVATNGSNSVFSIHTAVGGGRGGGGGTPGANGGSGGGGSTGAGILGGNGIVGQGNTGGTGNSSAGPVFAGGGGGGAGAAGQAATTNRGGNGGIGLAYSITGSSIYYAGGGGGGSQGATVQALGGLGGGGDAGIVPGANNGKEAEIKTLARLLMVAQVVQVLLFFVYLKVRLQNFLLV